MRVYQFRHLGLKAMQRAESRIKVGLQGSAVYLNESYHTSALCFLLSALKLKVRVGLRATTALARPPAT